MPIVVRPQHLQRRIAELEKANGMPITADVRPSRFANIFTRQRPIILGKTELLEKAINVARRPEDMQLLLPGERDQVEQVVKALQVGSGGRANPTRRAAEQQRPVSAAVLAARAHQILGASSTITPVDIALAMQEQGLTMVEPFGPGQPLQPYYGYGRQPRKFDYQVATNTTTQTRPERIPFATLNQLFQGYDVARICTRHSINSLRSMRIRFEAMEGYQGNAKKDIIEARRLLRRPDGQKSLKNFIAENMLDLWRYDSAPIFRLRDRAGRLKRLQNISAPTIAPKLDYFGQIPMGRAPAFQQIIEGLPWNDLFWDDLIYEPFWPESESPYGTPPLETVLLNANTDVRLQLYFLQFFTAGSVPEAFAIAPEDMTSGDDIASFEEQYYSYFQGDQANRYGLHWLPNGTELEFYKPQMFDPDLAEYVMRRTVAAFMLNPHDLGFTADTNRSSGDTQMDVTEAISDVPTKGYYEDIFDGVLQDDWELPVQLRFIPAANEQDNLNEANARYLYWEMGALRSTDVREELGYPVEDDEQMPLIVMDPRLGPIPAAHIIAVSGDINPFTGMPKAGSVTPQSYNLPAGDTPPPIAGPDAIQAAQQQPPVGGAGPKGEPAKVTPPAPKTPPTSVAKSDLTPGATFGDSQPFPEIASGSTGGAPGYGVFPGESTAQGTAPGPSAAGSDLGGLPDPKHTTYPVEKASYVRSVESGSHSMTFGQPVEFPDGVGPNSAAVAKGPTAGITSATGIAGVDGGGHSDDEDERADLVRWLKRAKKSVDASRRPRHFTSTAIPPATYAAVWDGLEKATTRADVDRAFDVAFMKAHDETPAPTKVGLALVATDTGRVVMVQRGNKHG